MIMLKIADLELLGCMMSKFMIYQLCDVIYTLHDSILLRQTSFIKQENILVVETVTKS